MAENCLFPGCGRHPLGNGYCIGHGIYSGVKVEKKGPSPIPKKSAKKLAQEKKEREERGDEGTTLEQWYAEIMKREKAVCWETGELIDKKDEKGWHGSIAHILPKKIFPSVATHPLNYLILKMWGGTHGQYDSSWKKAQKMKVWKIAIERFLQFEKDIDSNERKYIPDCFLIELAKDKSDGL